MRGHGESERTGDFTGVINFLYFRTAGGTLCEVDAPPRIHALLNESGGFHDHAALLFPEARLTQHAISARKDSGGDVCSYVVPRRVHDQVIFRQRA